MFSTRESFLNLFTLAAYGLDSDNEDFGNFDIEYFEEETNFSNIGVPNSIHDVTLSDIEQMSINNADFVITTVKFNASLKAENGKYLKIEQAEVRGRFFRMSPFGVEWEE